MHDAGTSARPLALSTLVAVASASLSFLGCAEQLSGPTPELSGEPGASEESERLVQPPFVCNEPPEEERNDWIEIRGSQFAPAVVDSLEDNSDVDPPVVEVQRSEELDVRETGDAERATYGDGSFDENRLRWLDGEHLQIRVDDGVGLKPGLYDVAVTNPAGDAVSREQAFAMLPRPVVEDVEPATVCSSDQTRDVTVSGGPFLEGPDGKVTPVTIGGETYEGDAVEPGACTSYDEGPLAGWSICKELVASVPIGNYAPGIKDVTVRNRAPGRCRETSESTGGTFRILRRPVVEDVAPTPICTEQQTYTATVTGQNFVFDTGEGSSPTVTIGGSEVEVTSPAEPGSSDACSATDIDGVFSCSELDVEIAPEGVLHEDGSITENEVVVDNPPGAVQCRSQESETVDNAPPPTVDTAEIQAPCGDDAPTMSIEGSFYFSVGGETPTVSVTDPSGDTTAYDEVELRGECSEVEDSTETTRHCDMMAVTLDPAADNSEGDYTISVANPETVQCTAENTLTVSRSVPNQPEITGFGEDAVCTLGDELTIQGENFGDGATVTIDGTEADSVSVNDAGTEIEATWDGDFDPGENPTLTVTNMSGCSASSSVGEAVELVDGPIAVFLDPPVHYNDISIQGTLYATGGTDAREIQAVEIRDDGGEVRSLDFGNEATNDGEVSPDLPAEDPNSSGNPLPAGSYDVRLTEQVGDTSCGTWVDDLLSVTDTEDLDLDAIDPQYGGANSSTSVRITANSGFQPTPRVYLSPTSGSGAVELEGVTYNSSTEINGIVPSGLSPGDYKIVVVNPDESVGILSPPDGFTITQEPPPVVTNVSPGTWQSPTASLAVSIEGEHFRSGGAQDVTVDCESGPSPDSISIQSTSSNEITLDVDTSSMQQGDVCVLTVTNPDGSTSTFSPVATVAKSANFIDFGDGTVAANNWNTPRRWPAMSSGTPSRQQRFLYTIGGDGGGTGSVRNSGEFAQINEFGNVGEWQMLPYELPAGGRTLARAVRIRDFIYLVGGHDGSSTTDAIHRANVLDPQHHPDVDSPDFSFADGSDAGLAPGVYYYRVSAVHDGNSDYNPGGETLASDLQPVSIPDLGGRFSVRVEIDWSAGPLSDVDEYRLYRTRQPNQPVGNEELLATFPASTTSFTDDGSKSFESDEKPLPVGSLGQWHTVGQTLNVGRHSHGVRGLVHPANTNRAYIFAAGGQDGNGNVLSSVERITIEDSDPANPRTQQVTGVTESSETLSEGRTELEAMIAAPSNANNLSADSAVFYAMGGNTQVGGGGGGGPKGTTTVDAWTVEPDGTLSGGPGAADMQVTRAGHVGTIANNFALVFGGKNSEADSTAHNSEEFSSSGGYGGWNSLSNVYLRPRYQFGRVSFVGFFYVGGGIDGGTVRDTVEYSVVGSTLK